VSCADLAAQRFSPRKGTILAEIAGIFERLGTNSRVLWKPDLGRGKPARFRRTRA
jgi:hypothetical protein